MPAPVTLPELRELAGYAGVKLPRDDRKQRAKLPEVIGALADLDDQAFDRLPRYIQIRVLELANALFIGEEIEWSDAPEALEEVRPGRKPKAFEHREFDPPGEPEVPPPAKTHKVKDGRRTILDWLTYAVREHGVRTREEAQRFLESRGLRYSPLTIKVTLIEARKALGIHTRRQEGIGSAIRQLYEEGVRSAAAVRDALPALGFPDPSPWTVRNTLVRLRREDRERKRAQSA